MFCSKCSKKILISYECRCGQKYCIKCKFPEKHKCNYDYKKHGKDKLKINNPVVINNKIDKI